MRPIVSPINRIPSEILAQIFTLLSHSNLCLTNTWEYEAYAAARDPDLIIHSLAAPEVVSHVCSRWRRVALACPRLWSHVDIVSSQSWHINFISRSQAFASRLSRPRLQVHLTAPLLDQTIPSQAFEQQLALASATIAPKIQSFRIDDFTGDGKTFMHLVNCFLPHVTPGALNQLALLDYSNAHPRSSFLTIGEHGPEGNYQQPLQMSASLLDQVLWPVQVLWLRNRFFPWGSAVYSGLVDLRLWQEHEDYTGSAVRFEISELMGILRSCPKLRIFHCEVDFLLHIQAPVPPVTLPELEDLKAHVLFPLQSALLVSQIHPGSKPLSFSIQVNDPFSSQSILSAEVLGFLSRANVTELYIKAHGKVCISVVALTSILPRNLSILSLNGFQIAPETIDPQVDALPAVKVHKLILQRMNSQKQLSVSAIQQLASICTVQVLVLDEGLALDLGLGVHMLHQTIPVVRCIPSPGLFSSRWIST